MKDGNGGPGGWDEGEVDGGGIDGLSLDGAIEQALGSYTPREPRAGLDQRVLFHIAAAEAERGRRGWSWRPAWALAAAMAMLAVVGIPLSYRLGRQDTAVVGSAEVRRGAEVGHAAMAAPLGPRTARRTFNRPLSAGEGVADEEPVGMEIAANTNRVPVQRATAAAMEDRQAGDGPDRLPPIALKPITIAPIEIAALN